MLLEKDIFPHSRTYVHICLNSHLWHSPTNIRLNFTQSGTRMIVRS